MEFYKRFEEDLDRLVVANEAEKQVISDFKVYSAAVRALVDTGTELAKARSETSGELRPLQEDLTRLQDEATTALGSFGEEAKAYRDSLR
jgi:hypothetical protein